MAEYEQNSRPGRIEKDAEGIFANNATKSFLGTMSQIFIAFSGTGAIDDAGFSFQIPEDYKGNLRFHYIWSMDATGTGQGRISVRLLKSTDLEKSFIGAPDEVLEILDDGQDTAEWLVQISPTVISDFDWTPGDVCVVELERQPSHANDTMADTLFMSIFVIEYDI